MKIKKVEIFLLIFTLVSVTFIFVVFGDKRCVSEKGHLVKRGEFVITEDSLIRVSRVDKDFFVLEIKRGGK